MNTIERGQFTFTVKTHQDGRPYIVAEPLTRAPQLSRFDEGRLFFELLTGTSYEDAQAIAAYMSSHLTQIGYVGLDV